MPRPGTHREGGQNVWDGLPIARRRCFPYMNKECCILQQLLNAKQLLCKIYTND